jgi:Transposase
MPDYIGLLNCTVVAGGLAVIRLYYFPEMEEQKKTGGKLCFKNFAEYPLGEILTGKFPKQNLPRFFLLSKAFLQQFIALCPEAPKIQELGRQFRTMIREQLEPNFDDWMKAGQESGIKELENFVKGIKQDRAAVKGSLTYEWSQGQVEGQVNRLKMLKRQMYGRAKFDLLRARVLHRV